MSFECSNRTLSPAPMSRTIDDCASAISLVTSVTHSMTSRISVPRRPDRAPRRIGRIKVGEPLFRIAVRDHHCPTRPARALDQKVQKRRAPGSAAAKPHRQHRRSLSRAVAHLFDRVNIHASSLLIQSFLVTTSARSVPAPRSSPSRAVAYAARLSRSAARSAPIRACSLRTRHQVMRAVLQSAAGPSHPSDPPSPTPPARDSLQSADQRPPRSPRRDACNSHRNSAERAYGCSKARNTTSPSRPNCICCATWSLSSPALPTFGAPGANKKPSLRAHGANEPTDFSAAGPATPAPDDRQHGRQAPARRRSHLFNDVNVHALRSSAHSWRRTAPSGR